MRKTLIALSVLGFGIEIVDELNDWLNLLISYVITGKELVYA
jgi:hypothetical protein